MCWSAEEDVLEPASCWEDEEVLEPAVCWMSQDVVELEPAVCWEHTVLVETIVEELAGDSFLQRPMRGGEDGDRLYF